MATTHKWNENWMFLLKSNELCSDAYSFSSEFLCKSKCTLFHAWSYILEWLKQSAMCIIYTVTLCFGRLKRVSARGHFALNRPYDPIWSNEMISTVKITLLFLSWMKRRPTDVRLIKWCIKISSLAWLDGLMAWVSKRIELSSCVVFDFQWQFIFSVFFVHAPWLE